MFSSDQLLRGFRGQSFWTVTSSEIFLTVLSIHPKHRLQVGFLIHGRFAHQQQYRPLVGHGSPHACDPSKILLQTLYPVRRADHRLNPCLVVQIGGVGFVGRIFAPSSKTAIILPPLLTECLPLFPDPLYRIAAVSRTEELPQILGQLSLVAVAHAAQQIAFQVRRTALQRGSGKDCTNDTSRPFSPSAHTRPIFRTPRSCSSASISPQPGTLSVGLLKIPSTLRRVPWHVVFPKISRRSDHP